MNEFRDGFFDAFDDQILGCVGDTARYVSRDKSVSKDIVGIFDRRSEEIFDGQTVVIDFRPIFTAKLRDIPNVKQGDKILFNGDVWNVKAIHDSGQGHINLELDKCT